MTTPPIRVGVVGVGYVGALHAQVYRKLPRLATLVAVCDVNRARAEEVAGRLGCRAATDVRDLLGEVEAASVCVPTNRHHAVGMGLLEAGIHVLMEKPIATTLAEANALLAAARRRQCTFQVGHIERFNAAIQAAQEHLTHPRFIEAHRLSSYPFRGTDVSVVLDVMIHDLDLVLSLVKSQPTRIDAIGVPVLSRTEDIANARLAFSSGCVANLTASRVSDESIRRIRLFQEDCYLSIDYKQQTAELARVSPAHGRNEGRGKNGTTIQRTSLDVKRRPPLDEQLSAFLNAVQTNRRPVVSGEEARDALALALKIERAMRRQPVRRGLTPFSHALPLHRGRRSVR